MSQEILTISFKEVNEKQNLTSYTQHYRNSRRSKNIIENKQEYETKIVTWNLLKRTRIIPDDLQFFQMRMPSEKLFDDFTSDYLVHQLNKSNLFEFEFSPQEGDLLHIALIYKYKKLLKVSRPELTEYLFFEFLNGRWNKSVPDETHETTTIKEGIVDIKRTPNTA